MVMKKAVFLSLSFLFFAALGANAQTYQTSLGAKFYIGDGSVGGLNVRHSTAVNTALEGSLLFYSGGVGIEGLYEYQAPINGAEGLQYFVGGGGMLGIGTGNHDGASFALRLTGGLDYKIPDAPVNVSLGLDPFFYLAPSTGSTLALGIGLRYVLK
jgi:hypothetical protein